MYIAYVFWRKQKTREQRQQPEMLVVNQTLSSIGAERRPKNMQHHHVEEDHPMRVCPD